METFDEMQIFYQCLTSLGSNPNTCGRIRVKNISNLITHLAVHAWCLLTISIKAECQLMLNAMFPAAALSQ